jgi:pyruvate formate lyase activating enzyme
MDAVTIDLKGFSDAFYARVIGPDVSGPYQDAIPPLEQVLSTLQIVKEEGVWLEIVNLIIPTYNDDLGEIREMCLWIKENLGDDVPLHFNRFFPSHKLTDLPSTPVETLEAARATALDVGLKFVYIGNVPGHAANSLYCPDCGAQLIERTHFDVVSNQLVEGRCPSCSYEVPGHW